MISNIEQHLNAQYHGRWRRLSQAELEQPPYRGSHYGWRVEIPPEALRIGVVDHVIVAIDSSFPNSQPRVFAPQAGSDFRWPHVERDTRLCLIATRCAAEAGARVLDHLQAAIQLLCMSDEECQREFEREFMAYWKQRATVPEDLKHCLSTVAPNQPSREIACYFDVAVGRFIFGESKKALIRWLRNFGLNPADREIFPTWLLKLSRPWVPQDFPMFGRDLVDAFPPEVQRRIFVPGRPTALLIEATTETGPVFASVVLEGATERDLSKGFRHISRVPLENIVGSFSARSASRIPVSRADGAWIHGRDHNPTYTVLAARKVAIVGCGAIGATVAKLLAQAGVGEMLLIDPDSLTTANVGRHPLGIEYVGLNKATALSTALRKSFPHLRFDDVFPNRFERLSRPDREKLGSMDLIVSAGIDFDGEAALDAWRTSLDQPPALVSTWAEAFSTAGHAVLLYGKTSIRPAFDESELPLIRLTDWPDGNGTLIVEAGCGNVFQPHGVVDLHPVVGMAASLAVDALTNRAPTSCRRFWLGDRTQVLSNGGTPLPAFDESKVVREAVW